MLCLADFDRLEVYFNNLINMFIENSFRKDIDLQIDMKIDFQKANIFYIDMKKDLQIDLKKDHHLIIRRYDHVFLL